VYPISGLPLLKNNREGKGRKALKYPRRQPGGVNEAKYVLFDYPPIRNRRIKEAGNTHEGRDRRTKKGDSRNSNDK